MAYKSFMNKAAACADFIGSRRSSTYEFTVKSYIRAVPYINCHMPVAPTRETALGFNADSITAIYFSSVGMP